MFNKLGSAFTIKHTGPQKIFGGPHAARGPQFGHPWSSILISKYSNALEFFYEHIFFHGIAPGSAYYLLAKR